MVMGDTRYIGVDTGGSPAQPDADAIIREVDNTLIEAMDVATPLLTLFGGPGSGGSVRAMKYWWPIGDYWRRRPTHGGLAATDTTSLTLTAQAHRYPIGTVFRFASGELVRVTAIVDANTVTVTRGYAGSTAAIQASTVECLVAGSTVSESDNWIYRPTPTVTLPFNYIQLDNTALRNSWPRQQIAMYGVDGSAELDKYTLDTMKQKLVGIETGIVSSTRFVGSASEPAMSGGLEFYVTSANGAQVLDKSGAALQEADIHTRLDQIVRTVGVENLPNLIIMDRWAKTKIGSFYAGSRRLTQGERVGGSIIDTLETEWGPISLLMHYALPDGNMYGLRTENVDMVNLGSLAPHVGETQEVNGPFSGRYYYSALGYRVRNIPTMFRIHNYSLTT